MIGLPDRLEKGIISRKNERMHHEKQEILGGHVPMVIETAYKNSSAVAY